MDQAITWILGLVAAFLGIRWQASSRENESLRQRLSPNKEKLYADIIGFLSAYLREDKKPNGSEFKSKIVEIEKGLFLHAGNSVVLAYGDFMQNFYDEKMPTEIKTARSFFLMGNLIVELRKDLGHGKYIHALQWFDPLRIWLKDIKKMLPTSRHGFRLSQNRMSVPLIQYDRDGNLKKTMEQMNSQVNTQEFEEHPISESTISIDKI